MKLNKFILLIILGLFLPLASKAEVNVDIQAAPQLTTKFSFRAGVNVEIPLSDNLSLDPGLFYWMRHRQREEKIETSTQQGDIIDIKTCELNAIANYLQLPVYISYNIPTRDTDLQKIMVGPYFDDVFSSSLYRSCELGYAEEPVNLRGSCMMGPQDWTPFPSPAFAVDVDIQPGTQLSGVVKICRRTEGEPVQQR